MHYNDYSDGSDIKVRGINDTNKKHTPKINVSNLISQLPTEPLKDANRNSKFNRNGNT